MGVDNKSQLTRELRRAKHAQGCTIIVGIDYSGMRVTLTDPFQYHPKFVVVVPRELIQPFDASKCVIIFTSVAAENCQIGRIASNWEVPGHHQCSCTKLNQRLRTKLLKASQLEGGRQWMSKLIELTVIAELMASITGGTQEITSSRALPWRNG